jgi:hypothetical protein
MEYLARLIAARVILRELQPDIPIADDYCVALYPLGNGWGFGAYLDDNYASLLCRDLASRVGEILDQFEAREPEKPGGYVRPRTVQVKAHSLGRIHPKSAVAFGLLRGASVTHVKRNFIWRKILGHDLKSSEGRYPWFLPLDTNSTPPFGKRLPTGVKDFKYPPDGEPKMPENMYRPHQLEELMPSNGLWDAMVRRLPPDATVKKWFGDSPLEIMIEKLYGPSLENEI